MKKRIALLGATGFIGKYTCDVVKNHQDKFEIVLATAHTNYRKLMHIAHKFNIKILVLTDESMHSKVQIENLPMGTNLYFGEKALISLLKTSDYDILLNAIIGSAGLQYTITGLDTGKDIALANKESLVMAGHIIKRKLSEKKCKLIPVDSEHSAISQCLGNNPRSEIRRIILTASGGPFHNWSQEQFTKIELDDALAHPTWNMGRKITIDSATLVNKGLEVIEAHWLFDIDYDNIDVVIHPQSIVHSFVEFVDGSILAQLSNPDMKIPIQYALSYPQRIPASVPFTKISELQQLTFKKVDKEKFPLLSLAYQVGRADGIMPTVFNSANETAVSLFLAEKIKFTDIFYIVKNTVNQFSNYQIENPDIETIFRMNQEVKDKIIISKDSD
ncbi:MAG: 1-deoxy-D-xylulose-5-phosphate reductoisomerase [Candidatus Cloacimonadota bacterium]|nr:MAG: 1-deoxy-D-xylulose-5-phosphate reductoisomerase [Candidatus Cloacimonadota bacterium]